MSNLNRKYFDWLKKQITIANDGGYDDLLHCLHSREFVWVVPNDDNRVADAMDLRKQFYSIREALPEQMPDDGATVLEAIVALSRRLEFNAGGNAHEWAWTLIQNLGLSELTDPINKDGEEFIVNVLDALIWRTYEHNGTGGFFPLQHSEEDQTQVEIWYQMSAFIREHHLI
jgi:hypothetical protein